MGVHRNIDANFLRGVMPKVPSKKHPYENFGMPYVFFMDFAVVVRNQLTGSLGCKYQELNQLYVHGRANPS